MTDEGSNLGLCYSSREDRSSEQLCQADYGAFLVLCEIKFRSRRPRIHFPEAVYHVICPGAGGENIK